MIVDIETKLVSFDSIFADCVDDSEIVCSCKNCVVSCDPNCYLCNALNCPLCNYSMVLEELDNDGILQAHCEGDERCELFAVTMPIEAVAEINFKLKQLKDKK